MLSYILIYDESLLEKNNHFLCTNKMVSNPGIFFAYKLYLKTKGHFLQREMLKVNYLIESHFVQ